MATRKYNIPKGLTMNKDVTKAVGASISSGMMQVTIDLAVTADKREVLHALDTIMRYIRKDVWPPA